MSVHHVSWFEREVSSTNGKMLMRMASIFLVTLMVGMYVGTALPEGRLIDVIAGLLILALITTSVSMVLHPRTNSAQ